MAQGNCPMCGAAFRWTEAQSGLTANCASCGERFGLPGKTLPELTPIEEQIVPHRSSWDAAGRVVGASGTAAWLDVVGSLLILLGLGGCVAALNASSYGAEPLERAAGVVRETVRWWGGTLTFAAGVALWGLSRIIRLLAKPP